MAVHRLGAISDRFRQTVGSPAAVPASRHLDTREQEAAPDSSTEFLQVFRPSDYHLATPGVAAMARRGKVWLDQRFSNHAPLIIDCDFWLQLATAMKRALAGASKAPMQARSS